MKPDYKFETFSDAFKLFLAPDLVKKIVNNILLIMYTKEYLINTIYTLIDEYYTLYNPNNVYRFNSMKIVKVDEWIAIDYCTV